jgi:hypothetical protein
VGESASALSQCSKRAFTYRLSALQAGTSPLRASRREESTGLEHLVLVPLEMNLDVRISRANALAKVGANS